MSEDALFFRCYDGPGPVSHIPVTELVYNQVLASTYAEARAKNGLYQARLEDSTTLQTLALMLPANIEVVADDSTP